MTKFSFTTDHRGTIIEAGKKVAFNRSGDVIIGTILDIKKNAYWKDGYRTHVEFEMHILNEEGTVSKIKNYSSFVIIN